MMTELLKILFDEFNHEEKFSNDGLSFHSLNDSTHYFHLDLNESELTTLKQHSSLDSVEKYKELKTEFSKLIEEGKSNTIEKNSSLIVSVKCEDLGNIEQYQQQVLLLEEDEFYFKKYVLFYTENILISIMEFDSLYKSIETMVKDRALFKTFSEKGITRDIENYVFIIQLYIKLPFLKLSLDEDNFESVHSIISNQLGDKNLVDYNQLIENLDKIISIDFEDEDETENIDQLLKLLSDD